MDLTSAPPSPPATLTPNGDHGNKPASAHNHASGTRSDNDLSLSNSNHQPSQLSNFDQPLVSPSSATNPQPYSTSPDRRPKKSSSTCTTCRARKVRCNGARDVCSNCQRLGFPCSYDDSDSAAWNVALPRRRVKQACQSCHSRKARCSGHEPTCDRCRAQGLECIYRPTKRARVSRSGASVGGGSRRESPESHDEQMEDIQNDSDPGLTDPGSTVTPTNYQQDVPGPHGSFDALIGSTFEKFFRHVHHIPMYSFLHRASLMEQYHAGKVDRPLLLALIGITSCLTDMGPGMREYGDRCIDEAERLVFADYARPSTIKIQALVFMIKHRILSHRFPSAFFLLSLASRYAASLRLNYESPNLCFLAQESRRRLMWSLFCIDAGVAGGFPDFALWNEESIHVSLPCNERNFEFDLPQPAEKLIPDTQSSPHAEDIGSLALHIRIQHIRKKVSEFTKGVLRTKDMHAARMQTRVLTLHQELDDFASQLPASFQFSEASLRLRAYSPRLCVYVMIHLWWRQCHLDLYRIGLAGLREALPRQVLENLPESFLEHCQRQCVDHATAITNIFSSTQKLHAKMAADLDLALCAYQAARILTYAYHTNAEKFDLSADTVLDRTGVCLQAIREYCTGKASHGIKSDLEKLVAQGIGSRGSSSSRGGSPAVQNGKIAGHARGNSTKNLLRNARGSNGHGANGQLGIASLPPSIVADPWSSDNQFSQPDPLQPIQDIQVHRGNGPSKTGPTNSNVPPPVAVPAAAADFPPSVPEQTQQAAASTMPQAPQGTPGPVGGPVTEFNNAYEGALEGLGLDNGLEYAMGVDMNMWVPGNGDWMTPEFMNGGAGL